MTSPASVSLSDHVAHQNLCQGSKRHEPLSLPADLLPAGTLAGRLATKLDGVLLLSHPSSSSGDCLQLSLVDSKEAPRWRTITPSADLFSPSARKDA